MLKMMGKGDKNGKPITVVVFGLSHMNLDKLRAGQPIMFNGSSVGLADDIEFVIFAGPSERVMQQEFTDLIGPETKLHIDPRFQN